jgi:hypothetical protein
LIQDLYRKIAPQLLPPIQILIQQATGNFQDQNAIQHVPVQCALPEEDVLQLAYVDEAYGLRLSQSSINNHAQNLCRLISIIISISHVFFLQQARIISSKLVLHQRNLKERKQVTYQIGVTTRDGPFISLLQQASSNTT